MTGGTKGTSAGMQILYQTETLRNRWGIILIKNNFSSTTNMGIQNKLMEGF